MDYPRGVRPMRGKLQIRYTVRGARYEETLDLPQTRTGVADALRIRKARIEGRKFGVHSEEAHPFEEVAQAYLDGFSGAHSTRQLYKGLLEGYWGALGGRDVASITLPDLIAIDDASDWPSATTRTNALIPLRGTLKHAVQRGWISQNPAREMASSKRKNPEPDPYTAEERDTLLGYLDGTLAGFYFRVAFGTGARTGELIALTWDDYDGESLWINKGRVRKRLKDTKTGYARRVLLLTDTVQVIEAQPRPIQGGPMFQNQYGRHYQSGTELNKWFRKAHEETGLRPRKGGQYNKYPWRHTYASLALSAGVKPALIASQLGHGLNVLLRTYGKYIPREDDANELAKMAGLGADGVQAPRKPA